MLAVRLFSSDVAFVPKHNPILSLLNGSLTVSFWPLAGGGNDDVGGGRGASLRFFSGCNLDW